MSRPAAVLGAAGGKILGLENPLAAQMMAIQICKIEKMRFIAAFSRC
jgi:hypothetical protein